VDTSRLKYMSAEGSHVVRLVDSCALVMTYTAREMVVAGSMRLTGTDHSDSRFQDTGGSPKSSRATLRPVKALL